MSEYQSEAKQASHTPGPWTKPRVYRDSTSQPYRIAIYGNHGATEVHSNLHRAVFDKSEFEEALANAHLIATAPELLEALENLLIAYIQELTPAQRHIAAGESKWEGVEELDGNIRETRAAIAKAKAKGTP